MADGDEQRADGGRDRRRDLLGAGVPPIAREVSEPTTTIAPASSAGTSRKTQRMSPVTSVQPAASSGTSGGWSG